MIVLKYSWGLGRSRTAVH